ELDPLNGRFALGYLRTLAARGDRAQALDFARHHAQLVRRELETEPDAEVQRLDSSLRASAQPPSAPCPRPVAEPTAVGPHDVEPAGAPAGVSRPLQTAVGPAARRFSRVVAALGAVTAIGL